MDDFLSIIGIALLALALFIGGAVSQNVTRDTRCKEGVPVVVDGKVYVCVEKK